MNNELLEALTILEKEKDISKDTLLEAIEQSLLQACKNHFGKADNVKVNINPETCEFHVVAEKTVVEKVEDRSDGRSACTNAKLLDSKYELGDIVRCRDQIQRVWPNRHPEREERDSAEDQGGGAKGSL